MSSPSLTTVPFEGSWDSVLAAIPAGPGVGQILGEGARNLLIGRAANLRRWAASHLGGGRPPRKGARPRTDLRPIAVEIRHALTTSAFHQRLVFERIMAGYVPPDARRDLKPPVFLHLDPTERFPRVTVCTATGSRADLFGPFRDRRAGERAVASLHKRFPLRPCDYVFEPDPALPLGLGCVYAQMQTCAAPCLMRTSEEQYRALAVEAVRFLRQPDERVDGDSSIPAWSTSVEGSRGLVVERGANGIELYPVVGGAIFEEAAATTTLETLDAAVAGLRWPSPDAARDDMRWLAAWLHAPKRGGKYLVAAGDRVELAKRVRATVTGAPD